MTSCALCGIICINQSELGMVEACGKFEGDALGPGCHCVKPCGWSNLAGVLSLRVQQLNTEVESRTKDSVFLHVRVSVFYRVIPDEAYSAFYRLSNPQQQLCQLVYNHIRAQVPHFSLDDVFTAKDEIAKALKDALEAELHSYGYEIAQVLLTDIEPNAVVKQSMNEINAAARRRVAAFETAEADKIRVVKAAEAEAEAKRLSGVGLAEQRKAVIAGLRDSIRDFTDSNRAITDMQVMELLLMNQYFDTLKDMSTHSKSTAVFVPHTPNIVSGLGNQVRDAFMQAIPSMGALSGPSKAQSMQ